MNKKITEYKYYFIYSLLEKDGKEKLFPFSFYQRLNAENFLGLLKQNSKELKQKVFSQTDFNIKPFLFVEKTHLTADKIHSEEDFLSNEGSGKIIYSMIPTDFVSEVIFSDHIPTSTLSGSIKKLIEEATPA